MFSALEVFYENALYKFTFDIDIDIKGENGGEGRGEGGKEGKEGKEGKGAPYNEFLATPMGSST